MRLIFSILLVTLAGLFLGGFTAWYSIQHAHRIGAINVGPWTAFSTSATVTDGTLNWTTVNMGGPFPFATPVRWRAKHPSGNWSNTLVDQLGNPE